MELAVQGDAAALPLTVLIVFGVAKLFAEIFERIGQPAILGEILAGNGTQVYITVRSPAAPAVLINQPTASAEQPPDPDSANNQVTTTVQVN